MSYIKKFDNTNVHRKQANLVTSCIDKLRFKPLTKGTVPVLIALGVKNQWIMTDND